MWIVGFIAVHINLQTACSCDFAKFFHRRRAVCHGAFEMRDTPNNIDTHVQGADGVFACCWITIKTVLWEGDKL